MRAILPQHRSLSGAFLVLVVCSVLAYMFLGRPREKDVADMRRGLEEKQRRLARGGWPLDAERLEALHEQMKLRLEGRSRRRPDTASEASGTKSRAELLFREATNVFDPKVRELFGSTEVFVKGVSRLDYEEEFSRLKKNLESKEVFLTEEILNLGESTSSPYTYQLVLQVWTLQMLVDLASEHGLEFVPNNDVTVIVGAEEKKATRVSVLPMRAYYLYPQDPDPYVLEFPVHMTVRCEVRNLMGFLQSLHSDGRFLPVRHMELFTDNPGDEQYLSGVHVRVDRLRVELECSAFFRLCDASPVPQRGRDAGGRQGA